MLGGVEDVSRLQYLVPGLRYGQTGHDVRLGMRGARSNSIGPETSKAARQEGMTPAVEAEEHTIRGLVAALVNTFGRTSLTPPP